MRAKAAALLACLLAATAAWPAESDWPVTETPHFVIHHENPAAALGDYTRLEQIYAAIHADLWTLVPWMESTKTDVYIYKDSDSFLRGRFHPPAWSGGLFQSDGSERAVAVFAPFDGEIVAHELTHLYFHSYFDEKNVQPPAWLDEGLATMLQEDALGLPDPRQKGPVLRFPAPLAALMAARPGKDSPQAWVGGWYKQSESVTWFLLRGNIAASFPDFCAKLRDGADAPAALASVYGYSDLAAFEQAWNAWRPKKAVGLPVGLGDR